jgi:hypothetical protein
MDIIVIKEYICEYDEVTSDGKKRLKPTIEKTLSGMPSCVCIK